MLDYSKYYGRRYDHISYDLTKSQVPILEKAEFLVKTGIDILDEDMKLCAQRVLNAADAGGLSAVSIDIIRAAFASKRAQAACKRKAGRRFRDLEDIPVLEEPIWEMLRISE